MAAFSNMPAAALTDRKPRPGQGKYVGIDLGTTYSSVAYLDAHGSPRTIPNSEGDVTTPSVVLFESAGDVIVGREAKRAILTDPDQVVDCVKRDMGEQFYHRKINGQSLTPASVSALILKKLKQDAEAAIGPIAGAVITVPAYFDESRRQATIAAGRMAGLRVIDILNEPTSAALAYAFRAYIDRGGQGNDHLSMAIATTASHHAAVYDLGGGTFDVTIVRISGDDLVVLATDGDVTLGGRDWDDAIVQYAADEFRKAHGSDPLADPTSYQNLLLAAEEAKKDLSRLKSTRLAVAHDGKRLRLELTREMFEELTSSMLYRTEVRLNHVVSQARLAWGAIDEVLAVGGSSRMPQVTELLRRVTGKDANCPLPPSEVVAHGAAIHAAIKAIDADLSRQQQASPAARPAASQGSVAGYSQAAASPPPRANVPKPPPNMPSAPANAPKPPPLPGSMQVPAQVPGQSTFTLTAGEHPSEQFNPNVLDQLGRVKKADVTAHSLGVVAIDPRGRLRNSILIRRNTRLPATSTKRFGTDSPNQQEVRVKTLEGESQLVDECIEIGRCVIQNLPKGLPVGSPIDITFQYDESGLLHVKAVEATSAASASTSVQRAAGWNEKAVEQGRAVVERTSVV